MNDDACILHLPSTLVVGIGGVVLREGCIGREGEHGLHPRPPFAQRVEGMLNALRISPPYVRPSAVAVCLRVAVRCCAIFS